MDVIVIYGGVNASSQLDFCGREQQYFMDMKIQERMKGQGNKKFGTSWKKLKENERLWEIEYAMSWHSEKMVKCIRNGEKNWVYIIYWWHGSSSGMWNKTN